MAAQNSMYWCVFAFTLAGFLSIFFSYVLGQRVNVITEEL